MGARRGRWHAAKVEATSLARVHTIILHGKLLSTTTLRIPMQNPTHAKALVLHALKCRYRKRKLYWWVQTMLEKLKQSRNFKISEIWLAR